MGVYEWLLLLFTTSASVIFILRSRRIHASKRARAAIPPPGLVVALEHARIHLETHISKDAPSVVLCGGLLPGTLTWGMVHAEVAKFASVASFDRPGFGWSSADTTPSADATVELMRASLKGAGVPAPYILVGHDVAGLEISLFAAKYPKEVAGLVYIDAFTPEMLAPGQELAEPLLRLAAERLPSFLHYPPNHGVGAFVASLVGPDPLPPLFHMRHASANERSLRTQLLDPATEEAAVGYVQALPRSLQQVLAAGKRHEVPAAAVVGLPHNELFAQVADVRRKLALEEAWERAHVAQCNNASCTMIYAMGSGHFPQLSQPKLVVAAIKAVIDKGKVTAKGAHAPPPLDRSTSSVGM